MRKTLGALALLLVVALVLPSCGTNPINQTWLKGVEQGVEAIAPEYLDYVEADPNLGEDEKANRRRTVELLRKSIETAKQQPKE